MDNNVYIIGDVHGCYKTLCALIEQLPEKYNSKICFVGDLIDRGPNSKDVIELVKKHNYDCVLGNHEEGYIYEIDKIQDGLKVGCINYHNTEWYKNWGGVKTIQSYNIFNYEEQKEIFKEHKDFFKSLPIFKEYYDFKYKNKHLVVSHGHIGPFWNKRIYTRTQNQKNIFKESVIWSRDFSNIDNTIFNIFGHTPVDNIEINDNYINIDTGVYKKNGKLTCLAFPSMKIYQQERLDIII